METQAQRHHIHIPRKHRRLLKTHKKKEKTQKTKKISLVFYVLSYSFYGLNLIVGKRSSNTNKLLRTENLLCKQKERWICLDALLLGRTSTIQRRILRT